MKHLILISILASSVGATPPIDYFKYYNYGPQRMLAGYTHVYHIFPTWSFVATCDYVSNTCYSPEYTPDGSEILYISPDPPAPGGVQYQVWQQFYPTYKATNSGVNGNSFGHWNIVRSNGTAITLTSSAATRFYVNSGNYKNSHGFWLKNTSPNAATGQFNGFPAGTRFKYWHANGYQACYLGPITGVPASGYFNWGSGYACVEVNIPVDAAPGTYNAGWTFCVDNSGTGCATLSWPIVVEQVPAYAYSSPVTIPPMPAQYTNPAAPCVDSNFNPVAGSNCSFAYLATSGNADSPRGAARWCPDTHNPDNFMENAGTMMWFSGTGETSATPSGDWYYDGAKTFFNIASWFGDPKWANCSRMILSHYTQMGPLSPYNTLGTSAYGHNWQHFPDGIRMGLSQFSGGKYSDTAQPNKWDGRMRSALWRLWNADFASPGGYGPGANLEWEREHAYAMNIATVMREYFGLSVSDGSPFALQYQRIADAVATIVLMNFNPAASGPYDLGPVDYQGWMTGGLVTEALRRHYEQTHDPRDLYLLKKLLDDVYANYSWSAHAMKWMKTTDGPWCYGVSVVNNDPVYGWYIGANGDGGCGQNNHPEIGGMSSSIYAWWWRNFGGTDNTYQVFADELFTHGINNGFYRPKDFNQVFRFSFDYLRWRQGR